MGTPGPARPGVRQAAEVADPHGPGGPTVAPADGGGREGPGRGPGVAVPELRGGRLRAVPQIEKRAVRRRWFGPPAD